MVRPLMLCIKAVALESKNLMPLGVRVCQNNDEKNMTTFITEDSEAARKKMIKIPKELVDDAYAITTLVDSSNLNKRKNDGKTALPGYKRMKKIVNLAQKNGSYNKSGENGNSTNDNNAYITFGDAKRALHDMESLQNKKSTTYQLNGGEKYELFYKNAINGVRRAVKQPQSVKPVAKLSKQSTSVDLNKDKSVKVNNISVHIN